jgi:hypothetical protein
MSDLVHEFEGFGKIARLNRDIIITEKIDGTNAQILIDDDGYIARVGSRNRWIAPNDDNYGFAQWCMSNRNQLEKLGPGRHFGEWWGSKIGRKYGMTDGKRRFSLFNTSRWNKDNVPSCCSVVPIIYEGPYNYSAISGALSYLAVNGSQAMPGFMKPEGIIIWHSAARQFFKVTLENDEKPKSQIEWERKQQKRMP